MKKNIICKKLKASKFNNIFKQLDLIIINFGAPIQYSLHIASAVRVCHGNKIILNLSDEFLTKEGLPKTQEVYERLEKEGFINDPDSLLATNIALVNQLLDGKTVEKVKISKWQDLTITFPGDIEIQIMQDCIEKDFEYYRFIEFIPYLDDNFNDDKSVHYVVINERGIPMLMKEN